MSVKTVTSPEEEKAELSRWEDRLEDGLLYWFNIAKAYEREGGPTHRVEAPLRSQDESAET